MKTEFITNEAGSDEVREAAKSATAILDEALQATRMLSHELSPRVLQTPNLKEILSWLVHWMKERHEFAVQLQAEEVMIAHREIREMVFRCVRELLFNAIKHAGTRSAQVQLSRAGGTVKVCVSDQGCGFDPQRLNVLPKECGFGLANVRERVEFCRGECLIQSEPGKGTQITLAIPLVDQERGTPCSGTGS